MSAITDSRKGSIAYALCAIFSKPGEEIDRARIFSMLEPAFSQAAVLRGLRRLVKQKVLLQRENTYRLNPRRVVDDSKAQEQLDDWRHGMASADYSRAGRAEPPPQPGQVEVDRLVVADALSMPDIPESIRGQLAFDVLTRSDAGLAKYGTRLMTFNGRHAAMDAYQEVIDFLQYARQHLEEERASLDAIPEGVNAPLRAVLKARVDSLETIYTTAFSLAYLTREHLNHRLPPDAAACYATAFTPAQATREHLGYKPTPDAAT